MMRQVATLAARNRGFCSSQGFGTEQMLQLFESVAMGDLAPEMAVDRVKYMYAESVAGGAATVDHHRGLRTGLPEVVYGEGKTPEQIAEITQALVQRNPSQSVITTRVSPELFSSLEHKGLPNLIYYPTARICAAHCSEHGAAVQGWPGSVAVVSAGTTDLSVAEEAATICELYGMNVQRITDVGVAGIHRILARVQDIRQAAVVVVVAGMDGALPSVVAGLVDTPVIAVPTSVGYGANFGGVSALLTMLNSCATGLAVVNIDNGFGAATMAAKILSRGRT